MLNDKKDYSAYALDQLREYLICNDVEVHNREDLMAVYLKMKNEGYFYKADLNDKMDEVKRILSSFSDAYEKDNDILEKDLIFFGSRKVLEKMSDVKKTNR